MVSMASIVFLFLFLHEYIILNPFEFVKQVNKLYYVDSISSQINAELLQDVEGTHLGFLSENLAKELWPGEGEGENLMTNAKFIMRVLDELKTQHTNG